MESTGLGNAFLLLKTERPNVDLEFLLISRLRLIKEALCPPPISKPLSINAVGSMARSILVVSILKLPLAKSSKLVKLSPMPG